MKKKKWPIVAAADRLYHTDAIKNPEIDRQVGEVLNKASFQSLSRKDIRLLESVVNKNAPQE